MTLSQTRQDALLRGISLVQQDLPHQGLLSAEGGDPACTTLAYAMSILGDKRKITSVKGDFGTLLEANNIAHRDVKTPADLVCSTRAMLIVFATSDCRPLSVHRVGSKTVVFDPLSGQRQPLDSGLAFKPYAYELYASLPIPLNSLWQLLRFGLGTNISPLLLVGLATTLLVAAINSAAESPRLPSTTISLARLAMTFLRLPVSALI